MDTNHLPLLEDQNPLRRSEILAGTGSAKVALTEAIKSLSNVSGREADVCDKKSANRWSAGRLIILVKYCMVHRPYNYANPVS
ncbi:TPA: hypothetical protein MB363_004934 [Klebsiella quasipneumoniae subsp. similipneumoniae]|nr:hypothetical protein [Klebsiella quasipneumoniae subsp. similipneumoniae]